MSNNPANENSSISGSAIRQQKEIASDLPEESWETQVDVNSDVVKVTVQSMSRLFEISNRLHSKKFAYAH